MRRGDLLEQLHIDVAQMGDVGEGIEPLLFAERPVRPVGEARGFVEIDPGHRAHEVVVGDAVAEAADGGGDLRVEDVAGDAAGELDEDFDVLPRRMKDLHHLGVAEEVEEGLQADAVGEGIDQDRFLGGGGLQQAEFRPVGGFAQEFGIDRDEIEFAGALAELRERVGRGGQLHWSSLHSGVPGHRDLACCS